jgi:hypothetical protein
MNHNKQQDARPLFRVLAVIVALECVLLVVWSIVADHDSYILTAMIMVFLGIPMIRLAMTGYFRRKD